MTDFEEILQFLKTESISYEGKLIRYGANDERWIIFKIKRRFWGETNIYLNTDREFCRLYGTWKELEHLPMYEYSFRLNTVFKNYKQIIDYLDKL